MNDANIRKLTGMSGVIAMLMVVISIPLYFIYSGPPPALNVLTRDLINLISMAFILVFMSGLSYLIRKADSHYEWLASFAFSTGLLIIAITLVAISLETGVVFGTPDGSVDPTTDGPLAHGNILIHGSIKRMLSALYLGVVGYAAIRSHLLPRGLGWAAWLIALINICFIPSLYFGTDPSHFYSAHGWGNSALTGSLIIYWIFAASIVLLKKPARVMNQP